jgi:small subunit ribosomal protein S5
VPEVGDTPEIETAQSEEFISAKHEERVAMLNWTARTKLGRMVAGGQVRSMSDAIATRLPIREVEIVDVMLPGMTDEVLDVMMVQRMTDSGRRVKFSVTTVVGNRNGFVGMGRAKGKEVGPTIRKAIKLAKLGVIEVRRGCGSWECGCRRPHTLPFEITGRCGSVRVTLKPAPRGLGLAAADVVRSVLGMAGVEDTWSFSSGHSKSTLNYAFATYNALLGTARMRVTPEQQASLAILSGAAARAEEGDSAAAGRPAAGGG